MHLVAAIASHQIFIKWITIVLFGSSASAVVYLTAFPLSNESSIQSPMHDPGGNGGAVPPGDGENTQNPAGPRVQDDPATDLQELREPEEGLDNGPEIHPRRTAFNYKIAEDEILLHVVCQSTGHPFVQLRAVWTGQGTELQTGFPTYISGDEGSNIIIVRRGWPFRLIYHDRDPEDCSLLERKSSNVLEFGENDPPELTLQCAANRMVTPQLAGR